MVGESSEGTTLPAGVVTKTPDWTVLADGATTPVPAILTEALGDGFFIHPGTRVHVLIQGYQTPIITGAF